MRRWRRKKITMAHMLKVGFCMGCILFLGQLWTQHQSLRRLESTLCEWVVAEGMEGATVLSPSASDTWIAFSNPVWNYTRKQQVAGKKEIEKQQFLQKIASQDEKDKDNTQSVCQVFHNGSYDITKYNKSLIQSQSKTSQEQEKTSAAPLKKQTPVISQNTTYQNKQKIETLYQKKETSYLLKNFYIVDSSTSIDKKIFQVEKLLSPDMTIKKEKEPQILIYHTHGASEAFCDSKKGELEEGIIGVGKYLANLLTKKYGYHVIHDETPYDRIDGKIDRSQAYNEALEGVKEILQKNAGIQVVIDLHRDGVGNHIHRTTQISGKKTAQVMFFNGLSRNQNGNIAYLENPNLQQNLAFSLQMKLQCMKEYADFAKPIYLKNYRYNLHLKKRALLIELGNENNTLQEAKNAMPPLAKVLHKVLSEK